MKNGPIWRPRRRRFLVLFGLSLVTISGAGFASVSAHETVEPIDGVIIEHAAVKTAALGMTSRIGFLLENLSSRDLFLLGLESPIADAGALVLKGTDGRSMDVPVLSIRRNEVLNLRSSHLWIELRGLRQPIENDSVVHFDLVFREGSVPVLAHAHENYFEELE